MTYEEYQRIVQEVLCPAFVGVRRWTAQFNRTVVFPRVERFPEAIARNAARRLAQEREHTPRAVDWERACTDIGGDRYRRATPQRDPCPDCRSSGWLIFAVRQDHTAERHFDGTLYDHQDYERLDRLDGWTTAAIPCGCAWSGGARAPADLRQRVIAALKEFEERVLRPRPIRPLVEEMRSSAAGPQNADDAEFDDQLPF